MAKKSGTKSGNIHPAILILFLALSVFSVWAFVNQVTAPPSNFDKLKTIMKAIGNMLESNDPLKKDINNFTKKCNQKVVDEFVANIKRNHILAPKICDDIDTMYKNSLKPENLSKKKLDRYFQCVFQMGN